MTNTHLVYVVVKTMNPYTIAGRKGEKGKVGLFSHLKAEFFYTRWFPIFLYLRREEVLLHFPDSDDLKQLI